MDKCVDFLNLFLAALGLHCCVRAHSGGFSSCGAQALGHVGSVVVAHGLSFSIACGILPRDQTSVPCIGRWTLNHGITREVQ